MTELAEYILNFGKPQVQSRLAEIRSQDKQKTAKSQKLTKVGAFCSFLVFSVWNLQVVPVGVFLYVRIMPLPLSAPALVCFETIIMPGTTGKG